MKVVCINNKASDYLTIGKVYAVIPTMRSNKATSYNDWLIRDNSNLPSWYPKKLFATVEEYRQIKLEQLI